MHRQSMLVPCDLGEIQVFARLKYQRAKACFVPDQIGNRLVDGDAVLAAQLVKVTGQNTDARRVSESVLHGGIVQSTEHL